MLSTSGRPAKPTAPAGVPQRPIAVTPVPPAREQLTRRRDDPRWSVSPVAVVTWLTLQCGLLALGLMQVPLAASMPQGSAFLPELLLVGLIGLASLLAPLLSRSPATMLVVIASTLPALLLGQGLAAAMPSTTLLSLGIVIGWFLTLFFWTTSFSSRPGRQSVVAVAVVASIGMSLLQYLAIEFATGDIALLSNLARFFPVNLVLRAAAADIAWYEVLPLGLLLLTGLATWLARSRYVREVW